MENLHQKLIACPHLKMPLDQVQIFRQFLLKNLSQLEKQRHVGQLLVWAILINSLISERYSFQISAILGLTWIWNELIYSLFVGKLKTNSLKELCNWEWIYIYSMRSS